MCTRCGNRYADIDGKLMHVTAEGDPMTVKDCSDPVAGVTKHGAMRHVHTGKINGENVEIYVPDTME